MAKVRITGTSKGIGYNAAILLARAGHQVVATMREHRRRRLRDLRRSRRARGSRLAQELSHPVRLAIALGWGALVFSYRRERANAIDSARAETALSGEQGLLTLVQMGRLLESAQAPDRATTDRVARIRAGIKESQMGSLRSMYLGGSVEALLEGSHAQQNLRAVNRSRRTALFSAPEHLTLTLRDEAS